MTDGEQAGATPTPKEPSDEVLLAAVVHLIARRLRR